MKSWWWCFSLAPAGKASWISDAASDTAWGQSSPSLDHRLSNCLPLIAHSHANHLWVPKNIIIVAFLHHCGRFRPLLPPRKHHQKSMTSRLFQWKFWLITAFCQLLFIQSFPTVCQLVSGLPCTQCSGNMTQSRNTVGTISQFMNLAIASLHQAVHTSEAFSWIDWRPGSLANNSFLMKKHVFYQPSSFWCCKPFLSCRILMKYQVHVSLHLARYIETPELFISTICHNLPWHETFCLLYLLQAC